MTAKYNKISKELEKSLQSKAKSTELELIQRRDMTAKYDLLTIELEESRRLIALSSKLETVKAKIEVEDPHSDSVVAASVFDIERREMTAKYELLAKELEKSRQSAVAVDSSDSKKKSFLSGIPSVVPHILKAALAKVAPASTSVEELTFDGIMCLLIFLVSLLYYLIDIFIIAIYLLFGRCK